MKGRMHREVPVQEKKRKYEGTEKRYYPETKSETKLNLKIYIFA
jgi:hypothetical protein